MRQTIASPRGDSDLLIAMKATNRPHMQDTPGIAALLLEASRAAEALERKCEPERRALGEADNILTTTPETGVPRKHPIATV